MKITRTDENTFTPYTISIRVETKEEQAALNAMCSFDCSIPRLVNKEEGHEKYGPIIQEFLRNMAVKTS